ncbi:probable RNA-binding protein ARP1 [Phalaenopsis equestris]|uniref:probable RNA-binding protein ARP1 n=1 Tax=Phalaenopsis equestris TaxID=78828 RepID=UPI0009E510F9|nr:probable RNA-binding protein ARP1 [Phalaenopsis equestris]
MANRPPVHVTASGSLSGSSSGSGVHFFNSPYGDTKYTKVFVGGLAWETQSETLQRHFEQFGEILEAVVISDKNTGRSKGYGFVTFRHPESASKACANASPIIDGRRANCNLASLGRPRPIPFYGPLRSRVRSPVVLGSRIFRHMAQALIMVPSA